MTEKRKSFWGLETLPKKSENKQKIVVFTCKDELKKWIKADSNRKTVEYREVLSIFKWNQDFTKDFYKNNVDKDIVKFDEVEKAIIDEMDALHMKYMKRRAQQLESYIE